METHAVKISTEMLSFVTGRKRGNIVLQTNDPTVNSLSSSMQDADEAHSRCQSLLSQTSAVLRKVYLGIQTFMPILIEDFTTKTKNS